MSCVTLQPEFELEADFPAVVVRCGTAAVVVGGVCLHLETVSDDIAGHGHRGLVPAFVSGVGADLRVGKERRVAQRDLPFAAEQVAGLHVEAAAVVDEGVAVRIEERVAARAAHEIGVEGESAVFEDEIHEVGADVPRGAVGHQGAALAREACGLVVVGVGSGQQDAHPLLVVEIALQQVALRSEASQRVQLHAPRVGQAAARRGTPVASFAQRDGGFGREVESFAPERVVFAEETEVAVEVEFAVHDAAIDELKGARRIDARAVGLDLRLSESDVPCGVGHVVDDGVAHDVRRTVRERLGVVAGESQLHGVNQFRGVDVAVEPQAQPLDAGVGFRQREVFVERERQKILHSETHRQFEPVVFRPERDAPAHFEVGHVAEPFEQPGVRRGVRAERIGRAECGTPQQGGFLSRAFQQGGFLRRGEWGGREEKERGESFHLVLSVGSCVVRAVSGSGPGTKIRKSPDRRRKFRTESERILKCAFRASDSRALRGLVRTINSVSDRSITIKTVYTVCAGSRTCSAAVWNRIGRIKHISL